MELQLVKDVTIQKVGFPGKFDHNLTEFPLDGNHARVECRLCHKPYEKDGKILVEYKITKFQCIDCHQ